MVGVIVSYGFPPLYTAWLADVPAIKSLFGSQLNFFHSVFIAFIAAVIANVIVSKCSGVDEEKSKYTWVGLKLFREMDLIHFAKKLIGTIVVFVLLGFFMTGQLISPLATGLIGAIKVAEGFKADLLYTVPKGEQGSWVAICADDKGRLIAIGRKRCGLLPRRCR